MENTFLKTVINFTKNIKTTGAFYKTSKKVEREICSKIDENSKIVIEFGTGFGNITKRLLSRLPADAKLYSFEVNSEFVEDVQQLIKDDRLILINDGAQNFPLYVPEEVDCIVSSIPLTIIPKEVGKDIIKKGYAALKEGQYFSQVLYSKFHKKKFETIFDEVEIIKVDNVPTGFVHHCRKT